eukprot:scaffold111544_cov109-Phaeocystis_antarctica.AAC.1
MLAWGDAANERALASGTEGGGGLGPEVEVAPVSRDAGDEDGGGNADSDGGGVAKLELTLSAGVGTSGGIEGAIEYNRDLFARESVERLTARLAALAEALAGAADDAD